MTRATLRRVGDILGILALLVIGADLMWGTGHPTLSGVLLVLAVVPTLTFLLSRALMGVDFPPIPIAAWRVRRPIGWPRPAAPRRFRRCGSG
jgi:hypothetical protein